LLDVPGLRDAPRDKVSAAAGRIADQDANRPLIAASAVFMTAI
jgi:hypothetical protein